MAQGENDSKLPIDRITGIRTNFPDPSFDPLRACASALKAHFLPPRPDQRHSRAFQNWEGAMATRPRFPPNVKPRILFGNDIQIVTHSNRTQTQSSSKNWSGGVVRSWNRDRVVLVQGRWIVPDTPVPRQGEVFASSVWVGLDGHDPASRVMPQIGVGYIGLSLPSLPPFQYLVAWWQVWRRDNVWQVAIPIPVSRNDRFYGQVQAIDDLTISFYLKNETENFAYAAYYYMEDDYTGLDLIPLECRTAEWIVERPQIPDPTGRYPVAVPLSDYVETAFTDCNAATAAANGNWSESQLQRANLIRMNVWNDPTRWGNLASHAMHPGHLASMPRRIGDDALLLNYVASP